MKRTCAYLLGWVLTMAANSSAMASPHSPAALDELAARAIFLPTGGYARAYGNCYDLLLKMRDLRGSFWATPEGQALLAQPAFISFWHTFERYIEAPCHLCDYETNPASCHTTCENMKVDMDSNWRLVKASSAWSEALNAASLQAVFDGWRDFTGCMGGRIPSGT